ncbi:putative espin isoform X1 [Trypoxylus dichotomus]
MNFLIKFIRCLCVCLIKERGSWSPTTSEKTRLNYTKQKTKVGRPSIIKTEIKRPEWLKQWTISKGWMHNRSHMLNLGKEEAGRASSSSISTADIDELVSIENFDIRTDDVRTKTATVDNMQDFSLIFSQISENYRKNFPEVSTINSNDLSLPDVYKERLIQNDKTFFEQIWHSLKPKRKPNIANCKYSVNKIYNGTGIEFEDSYKSFDEVNFKSDETKPNKLQFIDTKSNRDQSKVNRSTLGKNLALYNTLNSKTNLHEDTIYECSEDSLSLYNNPIYVSTESDTKYYSFHSNKSNKTPFIPDKRPYDSFKRKLRTEKYIIRHIKVRIMLTLRLSKFKFYKKDTKSYERLVSNKLQMCEKGISSVDVVGVSERKIHEEQRSIGNGRTSMKIQNFR